jgi:enamine deaminase RidA (YjgF/YER057c/UK114 family)
MSPYDRLRDLGLELFAVPEPIGTYAPHVAVGNLVFLSGQGPREADGHLHRGKVGGDVGIEAAYAHARLTGLNLLSVLHAATGDLSRVKRIVKLFGMVNGTPDFADHPKVINGCSDLFVAVFGARGQHARSAVGMGSLPGNITVEIEAIVELAE